MKVLIVAAAVGGAFYAGRNPRRLLRYAVRGGLAVAGKLRELQEEIAEDLEDQVAEERARIQLRRAGA